jgi:hypothetical protein
MRQPIYRVEHGDSVNSHTTAWRIADRVFHTFTYGGVTTPVDSFRLHFYELGASTETLVRSTFSGEVNRVS